MSSSKRRAPLVVAATAPVGAGAQSEPERKRRRLRSHREIEVEHQPAAVVFVEDRLDDLPDSPTLDTSLDQDGLEEEKDVDDDAKPHEKGTRARRKPKDWRAAYDAIARMRESGPAANAPVDTMGCHMLGKEFEHDPVVFRFTTLVSLMLSSQTKDEVTAKAVRRLQDHFADKGGLTIANMAAETEDSIRSIIYGVGFHNRKASYLWKTANLLKPAGDIPDTVEGLCALPGVGPKMAYLAMTVAWNQVLGIGVDVHVHRISNRLGWTKTQTPEQTRLALQSWLPQEEWARINHLLVGFGQMICQPRNPKCEQCLAIQFCPTGRRHPAYRVLKKQQQQQQQREVEDDSP